MLVKCEMFAFRSGLIAGEESTGMLPVPAKEKGLAIF